MRARVKKEAAEYGEDSEDSKSAETSDSESEGRTKHTTNKTKRGVIKAKTGEDVLDIDDL